MDGRTYPLRHPSELVRIIDSEWGVNVSEQELKEPKADTVQRIYAAILADLLSLDVRSFERDSGVIVNESEYSDLYYDAMRLQMLLYHMARVAKICKVQTFTLRDLRNPTGVRTIRLLSAVCNFRAFVDVPDRKDFLQRIQNDAESTQARLDEANTELAHVEDRLASIQLKIEDERPIAAKLADECEELRAISQEAQATLQAKTQELSQTKDKRSDLKKQLISLKEEKEILVRSNQDDNKRVMRSPERRKRTIQDMAASCEQLKPQIAQLDASMAQLQAKDNILSGLLADVNGLLDEMEGARAEIAELEKNSKKLADQSSKLTANQAQFEVSHSQLVKADRQRSRAEDRLQEIRAQHKQKEHAAKQKHEGLQERLRKLLTERNERVMDDSKQKDELDNITKQQDAYIAEQQAKIDGLFDEFCQMEDLTRAYVNKMNMDLDLGVYVKAKKHRAPDDGKKPSKKRKKQAESATTTQDGANP